MNGFLILGLIVFALVGTWCSALRLALQDPSRSELEGWRRRRTGSTDPTANEPRVEWIFRRRLELVTEFAFVRTTMSVGVTVIFVELFTAGDADGLAEPSELVLAGLASVFTLWISTSVMAGAMANYVGTSLIMRALPILRFLDLLLGPLARVTAVMDEAIRRLSGANLREDEAGERLRRSIEDTTLGGDLDESAAEMLENVVDFTSTEVGTVMTPRTEIEGIQFTDDLSRIRSIIIEAGHSRIPVYGEHLDDIRGILYVKDLVPYLGTDAADFRLDRLLRQPIRVPETKPVQDLLRDFQRSEVHMAIVVDEYGGTSGLVTIEDVLEEIVGEIQDEHDTEEELPPAIAQVADDRWEMDARFQIYDLNELLETEIPEDDDFDTVAGFMLERLGRVPVAGEIIEAAGIRFEVLEAEPTRIERVSVIRLHPSPDEDAYEA
ncbi:MAG: HlyC/CorC family transporter [Phycisphaera sp. TMED9]|nr:MAG: HlyC/CorC family transporter [Phycisphaera sp. TMED9]